jgi:hypothetical protein
MRRVSDDRALLDAQDGDHLPARKQFAVGTEDHIPQMAASSAAKLSALAER